LMMMSCPLFTQPLVRCGVKRGQDFMIHVI
jgi:hypothetical protein